jgi:hypothetical protein
MERPEKDRYELRKNESIQEIIHENQKVWDRKVQLETNGFSSPIYEKYLRLIENKASHKMETVSA